LRGALRLLWKKARSRRRKKSLMVSLERRSVIGRTFIVARVAVPFVDGVKRSVGVSATTGR